ncbi:GAF domain-containing sensor histidine kinase [Phormidium tenue FACHB-886]|nr:GAF domain-containing sensor histidine kinase [Phormidium tenue FACHB-886]
MLSPDVRLSCRLDQMPGSEWELQRLQVLQTLGLLETESIPVFEEATQTAAHFMDTPICILGVIDGDRHLFKSAVGLSRIGLMNDLAASRQLPRLDSFCSYVVDSQNILVIPDTIAHPAFADSLLVQHYGIRSYLGVPLITSSGHCVGSLAVMGLAARQFSQKEMELLQLTARWSMSEFERNYLLKCSKAMPSPAQAPSVPSAKTSLIAEMTQELCTPLTSILGMASVLGQGIYGSLSDKQKKYIEIIHNSGQYLLSLVNEIVELGTLDDSNQSLNLAPVNVEMLCQQAIATLQQPAQRREQQLKLTVEPGQRIWLLDKEKVRQVLYHLIFSVIQSSTTDSTIRIHVSRRQTSLNLTVWASHPWLGDGMPQAEFAPLPDRKLLIEAHSFDWYTPERDSISNFELANADSWYTEAESAPFHSDRNSTPAEPEDPFKAYSSRPELGLAFSRQLAELHGGTIEIRGSAEAGYRYVIKLPQPQGAKEATDS